jgi:REP element-mobilizing transposase RayT
MPHTYSQNVLHVIFSTKDRQRTISKDFRPRLWAYVAGICKNEGILAHAIDGSSDHMHCLIQVPAHLPLSKAVNGIKSNSARWAKRHDHALTWQQGYAAFSVSASLVPAVVRYIENQDAHHARMTFDAELIALLDKHGVKYEPKFVFG